SKIMTEQVINCRTPGKVILHGEHAVVYGKSAVALSVDLDTTVSIRLSKTSNKVRLNVDNFNDSIEWSTDELTQIQLITDKQHVNKVLEFNDNLSEIVSKLIPNASLPPNLCNSYKAFLFLYLAISDSYLSSKRIPLDVTVRTALPIGAGLGSSSSYTVGLTASLFKAFGLPLELPLVSQWAFQIDKLFHGRPSGIDNSICTHG
ncbi:unnamed protein product, partial [Oppiella nova]